MQDGQDKKVEETTDVVTEQVELQKDKAPVKEVSLITNPQERMDAMYELQLLNNLINTYYFLPKLDKGLGGTQNQKITSSVQLNYFGGEQLQAWGAKIVELSERLGLNGKSN